MVKQSKIKLIALSTVLIITAAVIFVALFMLAVSKLENYNDANSEKVKQIAYRYSQEKCADGKYRYDTCNNLAVEVVRPEWNADGWIVYVYDPGNRDNFNASMNVSNDGDKFIVEDYIQDR